MAELTTQERLQPSLLDRLTDDAPENAEESRERRVISPSQLREYVTRDIGWLLNCVQRSADEDLSDYPEVEASVLNYGIPDLTGMAISGVDLDGLQRQLRTAIVAFEPRLAADTLNIRVDGDPGRMDHAALRFRIESEMWAQPIPINLYLQTEVDLETGTFKVEKS